MEEVVSVVGESGSLADGGCSDQRLPVVGGNLHRTGHGAFRVW